MGDLVTGLVVGALLGALVAALVLTRRQGAAERELARAEVEAATQRARAEAAETAVQREREASAAATQALSDHFRAVAGETLEQVVDQYQKSQISAVDQREAKLDARLEPLTELLKQYRAKVDELELRREKGYQDVQSVAANLLEAQRKVTEEAEKLNTILGRSSARGRWGEIQLERILEISGMSKYVDFDPQLSLRAGAEGARRPDVVVHLPRGASIAIDAKVPYDAFDRAMVATDDAERERALNEYAASLAQHVQDLKRKSYWSALEVSPSFVVCFVPSDQLLSAAFEADKGLLERSLADRVLVAGPTTLLGLLWSVWLGWSQFEVAENLEEITELAGRLVERTATLYDHVSKLGGSLGSSVKHYNAMVGSLETKLLVTVREIQRRGVKGDKEILAVDELELPRGADPARWPSNALEGPPALEAEVVELGPEGDDGAVG